MKTLFIAFLLILSVSVYSQKKDIKSICEKDTFIINVNNNPIPEIMDAVKDSAFLADEGYHVWIENNYLGFWIKCRAILNVETVSNYYFDKKKLKRRLKKHDFILL